MTIRVISTATIRRKIEKMQLDLVRAYEQRVGELMQRCAWLPPAELLSHANNAFAIHEHEVNGLMDAIAVVYLENPIKAVVTLLVAGPLPVEVARSIVKNTSEHAFAQSPVHKVVMRCVEGSPEHNMLEGMNEFHHVATFTGDVLIGNRVLNTVVYEAVAPGVDKQNATVVADTDPEEESTVSQFEPEEIVEELEDGQEEERQEERLLKPVPVPAQPPQPAPNKMQVYANVMRKAANMDRAQGVVHTLSLER